VCQRPFTWRKKWERCWDEVKTCSKRCNAQRKADNRSHSDGANSDEDGKQLSEPGQAGDRLASNEAKRAAKKAVKAERRAVREGRADVGTGRKECSLCLRSVDLLIRCQVDDAKQWKLVCGRCWKLPTVAGGVADGSGKNPHYRYGGLWKNLRKQLPASSLRDDEVGAKSEAELRDATRCLVQLDCVGI